MHFAAFLHINCSIFHPQIRFDVLIALKEVNPLYNTFENDTSATGRAALYF